MTLTEDLRADDIYRVVSRPLSVRLSASFSSALLTLVATAITGAALPSAVGGFVFVLGIPLVIYASIRGFRILFTADRDKIIVRNYFRTHLVRWEDIEAISVGLHGMGGIPLDAVVIRHRGRPAVVSVQATVSNSRERRRVLNALKTMRPDLSVRFREEGQP
jgi:hypothetical protein